MVAMWHTHPFSHGDSLPHPQCPLPVNSPPGTQGYYDSMLNGGGSPQDWTIINNPYLGNYYPNYIIDRNEFIRLDPNTPRVDWPKNPNRWIWNNSICDWFDTTI